MTWMNDIKIGGEGGKVSCSPGLPQIHYVTKAGLRSFISLSAGIIGMHYYAWMNGYLGIRKPTGVFEIKKG